MRIPILILLAAISSLSVDLHGATYFVRSGSSGNGTSWANAWGNLNSIAWSSLAAGDTVCVAGGTYSAGISTGKSGSSGNPITVKRATAGDAKCGSSTSGWNAAYDSQVITNGSITINNSYVTIDGAVPNGIKVNMKNTDYRYVGIGSTHSAATSNVTVRYIEVSGPCLTTQAECSNNADHVSLEIYGTGGPQSNWLAQYLNVHGACMNALLLNAPNLIWEHSRLADSWDNSGRICHPNVIQVNGSGETVVFRYNEVTNWNTEGIMFLSPATYIVYGNVWHDPATGSYPRVAETQTSNAGLILYNNTFVNMGSYGTIMSAGGTWSSTSQGRNNIWWNSPNVGGNLPNKDYDLSNRSTGQTNGQTLTTSPFVNVNAGTIAGYRLATGTAAGANLGSPYNIDFDGKTRTTWDRGAFEFNGTAAQPNPPTNLGATVR